ncbi:3'-5' exonuclease [Sphingomonas sp. CFBP 8760]|uniref:3'-5' exonuclease n=1 Tax=Sphingomonas sp. CFBP 8760 TaxID=2775282 RepID=UPI0017862FD5|nr:3'-5' exonuclease [Sphingomonas sp. CFBP 8760]MBD8548627.1 DNA polymerase III subunit epsilon [Sphingomonas sp. CFBP 8760]
MGNDISAHGRAAALLDGHPDYRVLRALPPPEAYPVAKPQGQVRTAAVIDVETIGLDADHPIIDLAIQRIAFDARGMIVQVGQPRQWFEDPGMPIPAEITRLTGITDADVVGKRIDTDEAVSLIASTTVAIAHNAAFDAVRVERRLPAIAGHAWACSCNEVPWPELGFDGRKLGHLLMQQGLFHHGHRAAADVWATINLLGRVLSDGETALARLIRQAEQPSVRIEATNAPFEAKDALKARGYRWHADQRTWWTEIATAAETVELGWLRDTCSCAQPRLTPVTWAQRHRG